MNKSINGNGTVRATIGLEIVARPRDGIGPNEAQDRWLGAAPFNKVLDYGDKSDPALLVASERSRQVEYKLVPELSPPGFTLDQMAAGMKAAGYDIRGVDYQRQIVTVCEMETKDGIAIVKEKL